MTTDPQTVTELDRLRAAVTTVSVAWEAREAEHEAALATLASKLQAALTTAANFKREANWSRNEFGITVDDKGVPLTKAEWNAKLAEARGVTPAKAERLKIKVDKSFEASKLPADERRNLEGVYEYLADIFAKYWEPLSRGMQPGNPRKPLIDGTMNAMTMRTGGYYHFALKAVMYLYGDPKAFALMKQFVRIVFADERMAKGYGPTATERMVQYRGKTIPDEQLGLRRFNYQWTGNVTTLSTTPPDYIDTDTRRDLDFDLIGATVADLEVMMLDNREDAAEEYALISQFAADYRARLRFASETDSPDAPWYIWGKSISHAAIARWYAHGIFAITHDDDDDERIASEFYGAALAADDEIVMIEGIPVAIRPHYVKALQAARNEDVSKGQEFQDITYPREENPLELFGFIHGLSFVTEDYLEASANNFHMVVLFGGPNGKGVAATLGGYGPAEFNGKAGVTYRGKLYPARYKNFRVDQFEGMQQVTHGLHTIWSAWATDAKQAKADLEAMNETADSKKYKRFGARVGLMFCYGKTPRQS